MDTGIAFRGKSQVVCQCSCQVLRDLANRGNGCCERGEGLVDLLLMRSKRNREFDDRCMIEIDAVEKKGEREIDAVEL